MFRLVAEVPAAPVVGIGVDMAILISAVAFFVVMLGLKKGYDYSLGAIFRGLARVLDFKVWRFHVNLGAGLDRLDHWVQSILASGLLASETVIAKWWHAQKELVLYTYDSLAFFAHRTLSAFDALVHGTLPKVVTSVTRPVVNDLAAIRRVLRAEVRHFELEIAHRAHAIEATLERDFGRAWRGIDHIRARDIPKLWKWAVGAGAAIIALRKYAHRVLSRRISRLERLVLGSALAGTILFVVTRAFPWLRCTNVRNVARAICRFPTGALNLLLGLEFELIAVSQLCDLVGLLASISRQVEPVLLDFVSAEDVLINCPHALYPKDLPIPKPDLVSDPTNLPLAA